MSATDSPSVLQRMTAAATPVVAEVPLTASRAVKLALTRAAEASISLILTVEKISEETQAFDQLLASLSDDMILLWLDKNKAHAGVLALDKEFSSAIVEIRTTGRVREAAAPDRRATAADLSLARPFFEGILNELNQTTDQTALEGWTEDIKIGDRISSVRATSLALPEDTFRHMTVQVDFGVGGRKGMIHLVLPHAGDIPRPVAAVEPTVNWAQEMEDTVMESPAMLEAILHRSKFPLSLLADISIGQVIPLAGCSVSSVKLEAADGTFVGRGRIGQMGGNIAVRVETPVATPMIDLGHDQRAAGPEDRANMMSLPADEFAPEPVPDNTAFDGEGLGADPKTEGFPDIAPEENTGLPDVEELLPQQED